MTLILTSGVFIILLQCAKHEKTVCRQVLDACIKLLAISKYVDSQNGTEILTAKQFG